MSHVWQALLVSVSFLAEDFQDNSSARAMTANASSLHHSFGQEFYPYESIRALRLADKARVTDRRELVERISCELPQSSAGTRRRVAEKLVQRYFNSTKRVIMPAPQCQPFVRLVARGRHTPGQIELLYWRLAQVDTLVGALARELFYPVCIAGRTPEGVSHASFAARNGAQLFGMGLFDSADITPQITRRFLQDYAREHWQFLNVPSLDRALRILQSAGLVSRERMSGLRGRPPSYRLSNHDVALTTFVWALYDEFLPHAQTGGITLAPGVLAVADFARTLLLTSAQVEAHCEAARRHQFLAASANGTLRLTYGNLDALADALLSRAL